MDDTDIKLVHIFLPIYEQHCDIQFHYRAIKWRKTEYSKPNRFVTGPDAFKATTAALAVLSSKKVADTQRFENLIDAFKATIAPRQFFSPNFSSSVKVDVMSMTMRLVMNLRLLRNIKTHIFKSLT